MLFKEDQCVAGLVGGVLRFSTVLGAYTTRFSRTWVKTFRVPIN